MDEFGFAYFAIFKILGLGGSVCRFDGVLVVWWSVVFAFDEFGLSWPVVFSEIFWTGWILVDCLMLGLASLF